MASTTIIVEGIVPRYYLPGHLHKYRRSRVRFTGQFSLVQVTFYRWSTRYCCPPLNNILYLGLHLKVSVASKHHHKHNFSRRTHCAHCPYHCTNTYIIYYCTRIVLINSQGRKSPQSLLFQNKPTNIITARYTLYPCE